MSFCRRPCDTFDQAFHKRFVLHVGQRCFPVCAFRASCVFLQSESCVIIDYLKREDRSWRSATMSPILPPGVMFHNVKTSIIFRGNCFYSQVEMHSMEAKLINV